MARTTSASTARPIPAAWERMSERWRAILLCVGIVVVARAPKPVLTP